MTSMNSITEEEWSRMATHERLNHLDGYDQGSTEAPEVSRLPTDAQERKATPIYSGVLMYFPDAIAEVAQCSFVGNEQHNPGTPLHWDRSKSGDELDAMLRHAMEAGTLDSDGIRHSAKVAWRALANLQKEIENDKAGVRF